MSKDTFQTVMITRLPGGAFGAYAPQKLGIKPGDTVLADVRDKTQTEADEANETKTYITKQYRVSGQLGTLIIGKYGACDVFSLDFGGKKSAGRAVPAGW
jgi:hypothetical protein